MTQPQILMLIAAFLLLTVGSFVYFIATWDAENRQPVSSLAPTPSLSGFEISPPEAPASKRAHL